MKQYINKDALVAEIERRAIEAGLHDGVIAETREDECYSILSFINTLEVKEVDLMEEIDVYFQKNKNGYNGLLICKKEDFSVIAKHFFELGMTASNKAQKGE